MTLLLRGQIVDVTMATTTTAYFYDYDDGTYIATDAMSGSSWRVVILGTTVTVTQISGTTGGTQRPLIGQIFPLGNIYGGATMAGQEFNGTVLTSNGSWTVPAGINAFKYRVWGDGGGAGGCPNSSYAGGGGGGGGGYSEGWQTCSPGDVFNAVVGTGGVGGSGANGSAGTGSSLTGPNGFNVVCTGGLGGAASTSQNATVGGGGGTATGGDLNLPGSPGQGGYFVGGYGFPGQGGGAWNAPYGQPGTGGSGGVGSFPSGAAGVHGIIEIEW